MSVLSSAPAVFHRAKSCGVCRIATPAAGVPLCSRRPGADDELVAERSPHLHGDAGILLLKAGGPGRVQGRRAAAGHGQPALPQRFPD